MSLRPGSKVFDAWKETSVPMYSKFYFYTIDNPNKFLANQSKPLLAEKGPYVFRYRLYQLVCICCEYNNQIHK